MRGRFGLQVVFAIAVLLACTGSAFAQANAQLSGTVTDQSGGVVGKVAITLRDVGTNVTYTATSNDSGFYAIPNLPSGTYELKASYTGFAAFTQQGIVLTVGESATVNVGLQLAGQGEKVIVSTEVQVIEPTKTEISQVVNTQQIASLPISGRVFTDFALLTPGVATSRTSLGTTFTEFEVTQISFGGQRSFSNEITVDGADFVNAASGIQRSTPPQEAVKEFRVVNNSFGADYGRAIGGIVNIVTKSGTNDLHGSAYEYLQNSAADARSLLQPAPLPHQLRQNQFGGAIGGPIVKDKTFFFMNYEGKRSAQSPTYPPDLINDALVIDQAKALMGLAPEGCSAGLNTCLPGFAGNPANITQAQAFGFLNGYLKTGNDDYGFARLDHQISTNNRLAIRYNVEDVRATGELVGSTLDGGGVGVPSGGRDLLVRDQAVVATVNSVLSPNVVNTVLGQFARRHYNFLGVTGQPDFSILNDLELGHNFGTNDRLYETRGELSDDVSWVKGNHLIKFGADGNYLSSLENFPGFDPVRMLVPTGVGPLGPAACLANFAEYFNTSVGADYPTAGTNLDAASAACPVASDHGVVFMYAGVPLPRSATACSAAPCSPTVTTANRLNGAGFPGSSWANAYPPSFFNGYSRVIDHGYWGAFLQDQWRLTPKLTMNFGLRWDVESGLASFVKPDYNGWQPRVGLAYSPDGKTVLRAGFGIFFDRQNLTFFFVPNTQKIVAGYQCGNHAPASIAATCNALGILPQQFPNIQSNLGQATQGYQIFGFPASQGAAALSSQIILTGAYNTAFPSIEMAGTCFSTGACGIGEGGMDHNSRTPYAEQASAEIDHQFGGGFALNIGYLFVGAHKLVRGNNINIPCPVGTNWTSSELTANGGPTDGFSPAPGVVEWVPGLVRANGSFSQCANGAPTLAGGALAGLGPFFGGALGSGLQTLSGGLEDYNNDVASAKYHGLTVTGIERIGSYFNLTANYTYSHTIDNGNFTTFINLPVNQFNYAAEESNSNQDARHRLVTNFTATAPKTGWWRNFQFSSIITLQSGRPFTLFYGNNTLNDVAGGATDRVGGAAVPGTHCATAATCQTMIPRNTYIGDPLYAWDFRLARTFRLSEKFSLEAAVDAFNALNRANVDEVTSVYGSPVFCGAIPKHYNDATSLAIQTGAGSVNCPIGFAVPGGSVAPTPIGTDLFIPTKPNANFGLPRTMLNPRQFQFSAKLSF
ncbi:MAG: TonB-dependent receptor domain-containing protein [Candidatus Acidiferrales bacterium]